MGTCEHKILGQLKLGARQTKNAPLTGIYALRIIRRLIKPTRLPHGIPETPQLTPWDPLAPPIDPLAPLNKSLGLIKHLRSPQLPY